MAFTADDKYLISASARRSTQAEEDAAASVWDIHSGQVIAEIAGPNPGKGINENRADNLVLSADDRRLAILYHGGHRAIGIYDTADWQVIHTLSISIDRDGPRSLALSPDGRLLAVGTIRGFIVIYDTSDWSIQRVIEAYRDIVGQLAFSPDSRSLASIPFAWHGPITNALRVWDALDGHLVLSFPLSLGGSLSEGARGLAWSADANHIASATDDLIARLWDIRHPETPTVIEKFSRSAWSVAFSADGRRLTATGSGLVLVVPVRP